MTTARRLAPLPMLLIGLAVIAALALIPCRDLFPTQEGEL